MFSSLAGLMRRFTELGVTQVFCKLLAENDNSKQQIYLGGSLDAAQMFPITDVAAESNGEDSTYKVKLDFHWVTQTTTEHAKGTQLILYPQYPEVRLSGFLRGCRHAPNELLRPIPKERRKHNNGTDGRVLVFGTLGAGRTYAYLAAAGSDVAQEIQREAAEGKYRQESVFLLMPLLGRDSRSMLLERLSEIRRHGWHSSMRLSKAGDVMPYKARNGGGYTLEALLGIIPNGRSEPDYLGWEIKAHSGSRITLMTPEPTRGFYGERGAKAFVMKYGAPTRDDTMYFTGTHRAGSRNEKTGLSLVVRGFNETRKMIEDVNGAVELLSDDGECTAAWTFSDLMIGWNKKHSHAAYVLYESEKLLAPAYQYFSPVLLGEGTNFNLYLLALVRGLIIFDPGTKVMAVSTARPSVKARSQFRTTTQHLASLYETFQSEAI